MNRKSEFDKLEMKAKKKESPLRHFLYMLIHDRASCK